MATYLQAAHRVLLDSNHPLTAKEIAERAVAQGLLKPSGATPWHTVEAALSLHILHNQDSSPFMRTAKGHFTLRARKEHFEEYVAERHAPSLFDEDIAVFAASDLRKYIHEDGRVTREVDTRQLLFDCRAMRRREAEERYDVIQLVSFYVVRWNDQYLTYKRAKRLPEARLHGFYSIGFGGHLNTEDIPVLMNMTDPDLALLQITRELREELILNQPPRITFRGALYDTSRDVSRQHIALVYDVKLADSRYVIGERGFLIDPRFETLDDITSRISDFENWSVLVIEEECQRR